MGEIFTTPSGFVYYMTRLDDRTLSIERVESPAMRKETEALLAAQPIENPLTGAWHEVA
jgi:hypothetical protein